MTCQLDLDEDALALLPKGQFPTVALRPQVAAFALLMEQKLQKKDGKKHWKEQPVEALKRLMLLELEEFKVAHEFLGADEARSESVDVANYMMILWDRLRDS